MNVNFINIIKITYTNIFTKQKWLNFKVNLAGFLILSYP